MVSCRRDERRDRMETSMIVRKHVYAVLAMAVLASCSARDTKPTHVSSPTTPVSPPRTCKNPDGDHVLEKVGRTIFWLEIKLLEQNQKPSSRCQSPQK